MNNLPKKQKQKQKPNKQNKKTVQAAGINPGANANGASVYPSHATVKLYCLRNATRKKLLVFITGTILKDISRHQVDGI